MTGTKFVVPMDTREAGGSTGSTGLMPIWEEALYHSSEYKCCELKATLKTTHDAPHDPWHTTPDSKLIVGKGHTSLCLCLIFFIHKCV